MTEDRRMLYLAVYAERYGVTPDELPEYHETEDRHA